MIHSGNPRPGAAQSATASLASPTSPTLPTHFLFPQCKRGCLCAATKANAGWVFKQETNRNLTSALTGLGGTLSSHIIKPVSGIDLELTVPIISLYCYQRKSSTLPLRLWSVNSCFLCVTPCCSTLACSVSPHICSVNGKGDLLPQSAYFPTWVIFFLGPQPRLSQNTQCEHFRKFWKWEKKKNEIKQILFVR